MILYHSFITVILTFLVYPTIYSILTCLSISIHFIRSLAYEVITVKVILLLINQGILPYIGSYFKPLT